MGSTKFIRVMGTPRSGNHAIMRLLQKNAGPRGYIHFNLCKPRHDPTDVMLVEQNDELFKKGTPRWKEIQANPDCLNDFDLVLFSYENLFLDAHHGLEHRISEPFEDRVDYNLYVTRSLPNWTASWLQQRLRKTKNNPDNEFNFAWNAAFVCHKTIRTFENWFLHLRLADAALEGRGNPSGPIECGAIYDQFFTDETHRRDILTRLDMSADHLDLPPVSFHGGGSSFSGIKVKDPTELDVLERWKLFVDNPYFVLLLRMFWLDDEVRRLSRKYFPDVSESLSAFLHDAPEDVSRLSA